MTKRRARRLSLTRFSWAVATSSYASSDRHVAIERGKSEDRLVASSEDHALRRDAADRRRREVRDDDQLATDQGLRCVGLGDACDHRAMASLAEIDRELEQL